MRLYFPIPKVINAALIMVCDGDLLAAWPHKQEGKLPFSPVGTRAFLINKYLDEWGEAHSARDVVGARKAAEVLEVLIGPYLEGYWFPLEGKEEQGTKLESIRTEIALPDAEQQFKQTLNFQWRQMTLEEIFRQHPEWRDTYQQVFDLVFAKWRVVYCTRVIEENELLGGGQDALTMEGFEPSTPSYSDVS
jgi:hypothetical protein